MKTDPLRFREEHPIGELTQPEQPQTSIEDIQRYWGSFRRMVEAYWNGNLRVESERAIEDRIPKERLIEYRPK